MRSTDDINFDYIRIEQAISFLMDKLAELEKEYEEAFLREERMKVNQKKSRKSRLKEVYVKGKLTIK